MNLKSTKILICFALASILLTSGCVQQEQPPTTGGSGQTGTPPTAGLSTCLTTIDETKLPDSLGDFSGTPIQTTKPFKWTGPDDAEKDMPSTGYINIYISGTKSITLTIQKLQPDDYNTVISDIQTTKSQDTEGRIKEVNVKGSTAYVFDFSSRESVIWYIPAGDNIFVMFAFAGAMFEESQNWVNTWANTVC
ncbi:MAG: hypothetical protein V3U72_04265 [Candidatus Aenigmarchaeota archaeon]